MTLLLKNGYILEENELVIKDILIEDEKIIGIGNYHVADEIIDCSNLFVSLGLCDVHVHFREPGGSAKETIYSGSRAAARGGYTTVCTMPNVDPTPSTIEGLQEQLKMIKKDSVIEVIPYGTITKDLQGIELSDYEELYQDVIAFSDDGVGVQNGFVLEEAMIRLKKLKKMVVTHCEDNEFVISNNRRAEYGQIKRDLELVKNYKIPYHVCHISTSQSVEYIKEAKKDGLNVSCEVTPHHLLLNEFNVNGDPNFKMNPPLRWVTDQAACVSGVKDGTIEIIATDHAPHTIEEKERPYDEAPNGVVGLETAFPLLYTNLVLQGIITLEKLIELMAINPRKRFGLKGELAVGNYADIAVFDINKQDVIRKEQFVSKGKNTPFEGARCYGFNCLTIFHGKIVFNEVK